MPWEPRVEPPSRTRWRSVTNPGARPQALPLRHARHFLASYGTFTQTRQPVGIKIYGSDLNVVQKIGTQIESVLPEIAGTRNVLSERTGGGYFVDFDMKRDQLARYNLSVDDVQAVILSAIGGENVTMTVEGRGRYPVNVRYMRDYRNNLDQLGRVLVNTGSQQIP